MGVLDTTYTFTATDVVTSAKLNNVIDQTTFTATAVTGATLAVSASGQLRVNTITSNEMGGSSVNSTALADNSVITAKIADANVTTSKILDANVTTAKILDANITQAKIAANVAGKGPAFRAWNSTLVTVPNNVPTKILFQTEDFDTNLNFANSRFTATIAGYYSINACVAWPIAAVSGSVSIYKNGTNLVAAGTYIAAETSRSSVHDIISLNIGDFLEIVATHQAGANRNTSNQSYDTYFSGCLIRSA